MNRRKSSIKRAKRLGINNPERLSNKTLVKIVNRHNINKRLTRILNKKSNERAEFKKSDLDKAIELDELMQKGLKELAKLRKIKIMASYQKMNFYMHYSGQKKLHKKIIT